ncbi:DUF669 domain-containing protein [Crenalkalicoccus roseus]|uniref:DUF669 domain-containing protein n=1 Tax=Crenalkalicoccus roseus TaxID=1485588 RepID=UPI00107FF59B|nr:DUF669 domain-containing protein [Crenalkalicoccus roseus]
MAYLGSTFDASGVEPSAPLEILPPGKYPAQIVKSEMRHTRAGDGQMLWLELEITEGPAKGRRLWDRLNLVNPNQKAVEIAQRTLSAICRAAGRLQVSDSEELHFRPMLVTVAVESDSRDMHLPPEERRRQNAIRGYAALPSAPAAVPAAGKPSAPPPWRRSA